jgi:hypothetical protein
MFTVELLPSKNIESVFGWAVVLGKPAMRCDFRNIALTKLLWDGWKPVWLSYYDFWKSPLTSKQTPHVVHTCGFFLL